MKKLFMAIAVMAILMLPFTSFALTSMEEGDLSTVTGQAGVSINLDVSVDLHADTLAWGDADGVGADGAWVGLKDLDASGIRVRLRHDISQNIDTYKAGVATGYGVTSNYLAIIAALGQPMGYEPVLADMSNPAVQVALATIAFVNPLDPSQGLNPGQEAADAYALLTNASNLDDALAGLRPLTIDVATGSKTLNKGEFAFNGSATVTYVRIGLGTIGVEIEEMGAIVGLSPYTSGVAPTLTQELGSFFIGGLAINFAPGTRNSYIDIYKDFSQTVSGVALDVNVDIDSLTARSIAWGDDDGAAAITNDTAHYDGPNSLTAGYVGLADLAIDDLTVKGPLTVNVATDSAKTFVRITFADTKIGMASLEADVFVSNEADHTHTGAAHDAFVSTGTLGGDDYHITTGILGTVYMQNLHDTSITGSVDIYAMKALGVTGNNQGVVLDFPVGGVNVDLQLGTVAWGDFDGVAGDVTAGWVGLKNLVVDDLRLGGIITINVATDDAHGFTDSSFVRIGFGNPTISGNGFGISLKSFSGDVALGDTKTDLNEVLGTVTITNIHNMVISGSLDIYAPSATSQGIVINLDNLDIEDVIIDAVSWGDADGIDALPDPEAGYVGLTALTLADLVITGKVSIDVATIKTGVTSNYAFYAVAGMSDSFIHLGLGNGTAQVAGGGVFAGLDYTDPADPGFTNGTLGIKIGTLTSNIVLGPSATLATGVLGTLGMIDARNLMIGINGWVDIAAH